MKNVIGLKMKSTPKVKGFYQQERSLTTSIYTLNCIDGCVFFIAISLADQTGFCDVWDQGNLPSFQLGECAEIQYSMNPMEQEFMSIGRKTQFQ